LTGPGHVCVANRWRCPMEEKEASDVKEVVSCCARLALYLVDELEPNNNDVLERDLDDVYGMLVAVERKARKEGRIAE